MIVDVLSYNKQFVGKKSYEQYRTSKYPDKKLAIVSCMDTRLTELLPAALGLKNGDAQIIKNAGGVIAHPFGSVVKSLLIAIAELGVREIMIVGHTDCGVCNLDSEHLLKRLEEMGVSKSNMEILKNSGINLHEWLSGFDTVEASVSDTVNSLKHHPLIPTDIVIKGFVMDSDTGELIPVEALSI